MAINTGRGRAGLPFTNDIANKSAEQAILRKLDALTILSHYTYPSADYAALKAVLAENPEAYDLRIIESGAALDGAHTAGDFTITVDGTHTLSAGDKIIIEDASRAQVFDLVAAGVTILTVAQSPVAFADNAVVEVFRPAVDVNIELDGLIDLRN